MFVYKTFHNVIDVPLHGRTVTLDRKEKVIVGGSRVSFLVKDLLYLSTISTVMFFSLFSNGRPFTHNY